jgi:putative FmdB family regulatory protein
MPTYEYACPKCGHTFETFQSMKDEPLKKCPKCKKTGVKRLVGSGAGLIFKGSGFYITDYKKGGSAGSAASTGGESKSTESKSTESKPAESKPKESKSTGGSGDAKSSGTKSP